MPTTKDRQTTIEDLPELPTVREFAKAIRLSPTTVYGLVRTNQIPVLRFGRSIRILRQQAMDRFSAK